MSVSRTRRVSAGAAALAVAACWSLSSLALPAASAQRADPPPTGPTFTRDVAPIIYRNCTTCHRPGEIGPMSLITYRDVRPWARAIRTNVSQRNMPPWFADPKFGKFHNERRLSDREIDTITAWVNRGAPEGNPADLPPAPRYAEGWTIKPDVVFEMSSEFSVPADGTVNYKYFDVPTRFTEDKWVQAVEVRAGDRAHVHHVIVYYQEPTPSPRPRIIQVKPEQARTPPPAQPQGAVDPLDRPGHPLGAMLAAVATGTDPAVYPEGVAIKVPAGSNLTFQLHYTTNGAPGNDRTKVGLVFASKPPDHELRAFNLINGSFTIPAGAPNHRIDAEATFTEDVTLWTLLPHTHLRGKAFEYRIVYPDGRSEVILSVPKYDFSWQTDYAFDPPLKLPKGSRLEATAYYDNSPRNPSNPDPSVDVKWGDQTWEEMMFSAIRYTVDGARLSATAIDAPRSPKR
jgi:mono/diheme cytochrome c family protein